MAITFTDNSVSLPWGTNIFITTNISYTTNTPWAGWVNQPTLARSFAIPILANSNFFTSFTAQQPLKYSDVSGPGGGVGCARGFWDVGDPAPIDDTNIFTIHGWQLNISNYVTYVLQDHGSGSSA